MSRTSGEAAPAPPRRRPGGRSARVRAALAEVTLAALGEPGFEAVTASELAQRAGVHATTVYRRWGTKEALVADVLLERVNTLIPLPDTGTLRGDLLALVDESLAFYASPSGSALVRALGTHGGASAAESRRTYWATRLEHIGSLVDRAADRGQIPPQDDRRWPMELLTAPMYFRLLVSGEPFDEQFADRLVRSVLAVCAEPSHGAAPEPGRTNAL